MIGEYDVWWPISNFGNSTILLGFLELAGVILLLFPSVHLWRVSARRSLSFAKDGLHPSACVAQLEQVQVSGC